MATTRLTKGDWLYVMSQAEDDPHVPRPRGEHAQKEFADIAKDHDKQPEDGPKSRNGV